MSWLRIALAMLLFFVLPGCTSQGSHEVIRFDGLDTPSRNFTGKLNLPDGAQQRVPVVILIHGTAGPDSRYDFHRPALLASGIATFTVDFKTNVFTGPSDRPEMKTFHPWVFGALLAIRSNPRVDPERIGIMGFSLGGHLSISVASMKVVNDWLGSNQKGFAAHVGFYPACKWLKENFDATGSTGAPILILTGEKDSWGDNQACQPFCQWLNAITPNVASLKVYPEVHHGFDRKGSWEGYAPYAINNKAILKWNERAAMDSRKRAVAFFRHAFGMQAETEPRND